MDDLYMTDKSQTILRPGMRKEESKILCPEEKTKRKQSRKTILEIAREKEISSEVDAMLEPGNLALDLIEGAKNLQSQVTKS